MMRFALALGSVALATLASAPALADCVPGTGLCANVGTPIANAQVSVGIPPFMSPYPQQQPQVAPQPAYQDPYGYEPQQMPRHRPMRARQPNWGASKLGLDLRLDGAAGFGAGRAGNSYGMGGAGIGLRYRAAPHFGIEGGIDLLGGRDFNDRNRFEVVGSAGGLVYFNPRSRVQVYLSGGMLLDHARAWQGEGYSLSPTGGATYALYSPPARTYTHLGGYGGLGLEIFATRHIAFHVDAKGMVRQNVGGNSPTAEFTDPASGRSTNTSAGLVGQAGMVIYF